MNAETSSDGALSPGELIRAARSARGFSQARLAQCIGTRQSAISRLEKDQISPTVETLRKILGALGAELNLTIELDGDFDPSLVPEDRVGMAESWNRLAGQLAEAGEKVKKR